jgi:hypothetical protein
VVGVSAAGVSGAGYPGLLASQDKAAARRVPGTSVVGNRISDSSRAAPSVRMKSEVQESERGIELWLILLS